MIGWRFYIPYEEIITESFRAVSGFTLMKSRTRKQNKSWKGGALLFCLLLSAVILLCGFFIIVEHSATNNEHNKPNTAHNLRERSLDIISRNQTTSINTVPIIMKDIGTTTTSTTLTTTATTVATTSKYAYVTLLSGIDTSYKYRGFLYNALIMKKSLLETGSIADFIVMVAYHNINDITPYQADMKLLTDAGIKIHILPRLLDSSTQKLGFAEMALLKITPYSIQYSRIQFFDGDVMPLQNMDCYFELSMNTYTIGAVSPLNSGWYLAIPSIVAYDDMKSKALWRLERDWDKNNGWGHHMPEGMLLRGGENQCKNWDFNGGDTSTDEIER